MEKGVVCSPGKDVFISNNPYTLMCLFIFPGGNSVFLLRLYLLSCILVHSATMKAVVDDMLFALG